MAGVTGDLRFLASVGEALTDSLDLSTRLDVFVNAVVPRLADWATVNLLGDDGTVETRAIAHRDPALLATAERLRGPFYANPNASQGTPSALRSRRSAAQLQTDPASILDATDRALRGEYPEAIVTAVVGIVDLAGRGIDYASAGHPPPLLRGPGGTVVELDAAGLPLGLRTPGQSTGATIGYEPGSLLVLYTDGLIESTRDILEGESRLQAALARRSIAEASNAARALHDAVLTGGASDDVAILAVRLG